MQWASYPNSRIAAKTSLAVTSIFGSNDGLATPAKIDDAKQRLPPDTQYVEIQGGIHSFFGDDGPQDGDGTPAVSREDAQRGIQAAAWPCCSGSRLRRIPDLRPAVWCRSPCLRGGELGYRAQLLQ